MNVPLNPPVAISPIEAPAKPRWKIATPSRAWHSSAALLQRKAARTAELTRVGELCITEISAQVIPNQKIAIGCSETKNPKTIYSSEGLNDATATIAATPVMALDQDRDATAEAAGVADMDNDLEKGDEFMHIRCGPPTTVLKSTAGGAASGVIAMVIAATDPMDLVSGAAAQEIIHLLTVLNAPRAALSHQGDL